MNKYMRIVIVVAVLALISISTIIFSSNAIITGDAITIYGISIVLLGFVVYVSFKIHDAIDSIEDSM